MKTRNILSTAVIAAALLVGPFTFAQQDDMDKDEKTVMVGGAEMSPSKNIIENASKSKAHKTLVAAVKAADLVETLSGTGPFTVFAPTDAAFSELPEGTVENLLKPENKEKLSGVLTYHVISGKINAVDVIDLVNKNNGSVSVSTVAGGELTFTLEDGDVYVEDSKGRKAMVTTADVNQSNGVIHVIDTVLLPAD